jgi:hypothetical protein
MDRAGRWHVAFAAIPAPIPAPGNGEAVGIDRGVAVSAALSTGELLRVPGLTARERKRMVRLERKLARGKRGSNRRARVKLAIARLKARQTDRRRDWVEKTSTDIARRFDMIRVEDLQIGNMTRSAKGTAGKPGRNVCAKSGLNLSQGDLGGVHDVYHGRVNLRGGQRVRGSVSHVVHVSSSGCHTCPAKSGWRPGSPLSWSSTRTSICTVRRART